MSVGNKSSQDCRTATALFTLGAFLWVVFVFFFLLLYLCQHYGKGIRKITTLTESSSQLNGAEIILAIPFCLPLNMRKECLKAAKSLAPVLGTAGCMVERGSWLGMGTSWAALGSPSPRQTSGPYPGLCVGSDRPGARVMERRESL